MKVADLPTSVIEELITSEYWRIDIDPGLDAKHEFFIRWEYLLPNPHTANYEPGELAEVVNFNGYDILLPIGQNHHPHLNLLRLNVSADETSLTLFLFDTYHGSWFDNIHAARYGFLAVADRYQKYGCNFFIASYYHFSYLVGQDYENARLIMQQKLGV
ncbi:hypothetical protein IQ243_17605 [Nostocales cyanobacterium LEGE 11386]|nr:hypothetical protein [Nostocales cyanobacterium LEGE 11386]